jgi:hypothetical protein
VASDIVSAASSVTRPTPAPPSADTTPTDNPTLPDAGPAPRSAPPEP